MKLLFISKSLNTVKDKKPTKQNDSSEKRYKVIGVKKDMNSKHSFLCILEL